MKKKLVVLTGAGVSAESGVSTFRDSNGLWENYKVEDVASIEGWYRNPELVLDFYNQRRAQLEDVRPNVGTILPSARRLSRMSPALPTPGHEASLSPPP